MKERPIIFNGAMVRAILGGSKTQTRRVVKPLPTFIGGRGEEHIPSCWGWETECGAWITMDMEMPSWRGGNYHTNSELTSANCPYGDPGDRLWVREAWRVNRVYDDLSPLLAGVAMGGDTAGCIEYEATPRGLDGTQWAGKLRPSIHMPRWASRLSLEVEQIRAERVQEISEDDARAEGCEASGGRCSSPMEPDEYDGQAAAEEFRALWDSINGKRPGCSWKANPYVWAITFKPVDTAPALNVHSETRDGS